MYKIVSDLHFSYFCKIMSLKMMYSNAVRFVYLYSYYCFLSIVPVTIEKNVKHIIASILYLMSNV